MYSVLFCSYFLDIFCLWYLILRLYSLLYCLPDFILYISVLFKKIKAESKSQLYYLCFLYFCILRALFSAFISLFF